MIGNYAVPPTANAQSVTTNEDTPKSITLSGSDPGSANLTFSVVSGPASGTLGSIGTVTCAGTSPRNCTANVTYTPNANFNGSDSFTFKVNNGTQDSSAATVSITVTPVNDAPTCTNGSATTNEDTAVAAPLSCADVDGNPLSYTIVSSPAHGSLSGTAPALTYTPAANYNGSDSFTFRANDGTLNSNTATFSLTVTPVNDAPSCSAVSLTTDEDTPGDANPDCTDIDSASLSYAIVGAASHGTASIVAGKLHYVPNALSLIHI